jgi:hypothetical protein
MVPDLSLLALSLEPLIKEWLEFQLYNLSCLLLSAPIRTPLCIATGSATRRRLARTPLRMNSFDMFQTD